jgi:hypothetical protein
MSTQHSKQGSDPTDNDLVGRFEKLTAEYAAFANDSDNDDEEPNPTLIGLSGYTTRPADRPADPSCQTLEDALEMGKVLFNMQEEDGVPTLAGKKFKKSRIPF